MKTEELRIGNLVNDYDNELIIVEGISFGDVYSSRLGETPSTRILPIELTEEWLGKFGYEFDDFCNIWFIDDGIQIDIFKTNSGDFSMDIPHTPDIKHVHQLQNLYFALTEQELTIK